jgi:hypothetical protein
VQPPTTGGFFYVSVFSVDVGNYSCIALCHVVYWIPRGRMVSDMANIRSSGSCIHALISEIADIVSGERSVRFIDSVDFHSEEVRPCEERSV